MEDVIRTLFFDYPILGTVLSGLLAAHTLAQFIVNLTPTPRDDKWLGRAYVLLEWLAGVTDVSKALPGENGDDVRAEKAARRLQRK